MRKSSNAEMMNELQNKLGADILEAVITVHKEPGPGILESAYELSLARELIL